MSTPQKNKKYEVRRSHPGAGLGLFATKPFVKDDFIIEYKGKILTSKEADEAGGKYLFTLSKNRIINGFPRTNTARYINHSCKPNAEAVIESGKKVKIYAMRKIQPGEEISYDYGKEYVDDIIKPTGCRCDHCVSKKSKLTKKK